MSRLQPKRSTLKKLFSLSGNQCAFPQCRQPIVDEHQELIADVCHIEAAEAGGERFNRDQTDEERRSIDNLLILCPTHHRITNNVKEFPASELHKMKSEHQKCMQNSEFLPQDDVIEKVKRQLEQQAEVSAINLGGIQIVNLVQQAESAYEGAKALAKDMSIALLHQIYAKGGFQSMSVKQQDLIRNHAFQILRTHGLSNTDIREVEEVEYPYVCQEYENYITDSIQMRFRELYSDNLLKLRQEFNKRTTLLGYAAFRDLLGKQPYLTDDAWTGTLLTDYGYFSERRQHGHPGRWSVRDNWHQRTEDIDNPST